MYEPEPVGEFKDFEELSRFLENEFRRISVSMNDVYGGIQVLHNAPDKPRDGMVRIADGSDWDPGEGGGLYVYRDGGWKKQTDKAEADGLYQPLGSLVDEVYTTGSRVFVASDAGKMIRGDFTGARTFTIPADTFSAHDVVNTMQWGTAQITFAAASGVSLRYDTSMFVNKSLGRFTMQTIYFVNANNPVLGGMLELA